MFDNKFLKHDPLVEAVKQAQRDGDMRRQAEAFVNEEFGVYSRKAVVREELAAYDAAIEEAYKCMKEGKKLADKDYDGDGERETPKDEVWGSRFRAAKKAGKMEEGAVDAGSMEGSKSVTKSAPKEDPSLPKSYPGAASSAPTAQRLSNAKAAIKEAKGTAAVQNLKHRDFKETRHPNKNAVTKAPVPGVSIAEEDQLDELKKTTLGSYVGKAAAANYKKEKPTRGKGVKLAMDKITGRYGVVKGTNEEMELDEVSKGAAISAYREKEAQERDTSKLHGLIKRKFGAKTAHHAERAGAQSSVGLVRRGEDRGKEDSIARDRRHPTDRITKSGKVHKQDTATLKGNIKRRLGSHTKPGHLPEDTLSEAPIVPASALKPGQSLRDYLNAKQGLTQRTPENNAGLKSSSSAFSTPRTPSTTPSTTKWADAGAKENQSRADTAAKQNASTSSTPSAQDKMAADAARTAKQTAVTSPVSGPGPTATASSTPSPSAVPAVPKAKEAGVIPKTVAESVQIGDSKYRIV